MPYAGWLLYLLLACLGARPQHGMATVFGEASWDGGTNPNDRLACDHRRIDDAKDVIVASNEYPCHTLLRIHNPRTGKVVTARVADRGPKHARLDLSKLTAQALRHNGMERVIFYPVGRDTRTPRQRRKGESDASKRVHRGIV